jgi:ATP-dependent protease ClpP protease subunit
MGLFVTEYGGQQSGRAIGNTIMTEPAIKTTVMSSGSSAAATLLQFSSGTRFVRLASDVAFYMLFGSSTSATGPQSSTNTQRMAGNAKAEFRSVLPYSTVIAFST